MKAAFPRWIVSLSALFLVFWMSSAAAKAQETPTEKSGQVTETPAPDEPAGADAGGEESLEDDPEADPESSRRRFRRGPLTAKLTWGEDEVTVTAGHMTTESPDYAPIAELGEGEILQLTQSMAIKLKTPLDLKFGDIVIKTGNVAVDYPGVYSLWLKKGPDSWQMLFNEKADVWGTQHDANADVGAADVAYARVEPTGKLDLAMNERDNGGELVISFGEHQWRAPFAVVEP